MDTMLSCSESIGFLFDCIQWIYKIELRKYLSDKHLRLDDHDDLVGDVEGRGMIRALTRTNGPS
jgi:hypothetical protein